MTDAPPADPAHITAWQRLGSAITTSGALTDAALAELAQIGVRHVINLALTSHPQAVPDEAAKCAALGLGYTHIPVPFDQPGEDHFRAFVAALDAAPRPLHVHCIANWRVSAFFYRYHREIAGLPEPEARALMEVQWNPASTSHPDAPAWARFVSGRDA